MSSGDRFDREIAIGQQNACVMELARHHCQLMEFVEFAGRGMLEEFTGLPTNMRTIRCPKAHGNTSAMRLQPIDTEFFREHCVGCEMRRPTGQFPTLGALAVTNDTRASLKGR